MRLSFRRPRPPAVAAVAPLVVEPAVPVYVDALAAPRAWQVAPPFCAVEEPGDARLAVVAPNPAVVARLRERHPELLVLAIVPVARDHGGTKLSAELLGA